MVFVEKGAIHTKVKLLGNSATGFGFNERQQNVNKLVPPKASQDLFKYVSNGFNRCHAKK